MVKKYLAILICGFSISGFSCPRALPTDSPNFCASFKVAAICYCTSSGLPAGMCQDMNQLYGRLITVFGSLQKACEYQHFTTTEDCINNWTCYRQGGIDSTGKLCSSNEHACQ